MEKKDKDIAIEFFSKISSIIISTLEEGIQILFAQLLIESETPPEKP